MQENCRTQTHFLVPVMLMEESENRLSENSNMNENKWVYQALRGNVLGRFYQKGSGTAAVSDGHGFRREMKKNFIMCLWSREEIWIKTLRKAKVCPKTEVVQTLVLEKKLERWFWTQHKRLSSVTLASQAGKKALERPSRRSWIVMAAGWGCRIDWSSLRLTFAFAVAES